MHRYSRPSIKNQGGVLPYLDATLTEHNGVNGKLFAKLVDNGVNAANIARLTGRSYTQASRWIREYRAEQGMKVEASHD